MSKTMCKSGQDKIKLRALKVQKFRCAKCHLTAPKENQLCKPEKL